MLLGRLAFGFSLAALMGTVCTASAQTGGDTVTLTWTAVGDDGLSGKASVYDVRYSTEPITERNWGEATRGDFLRRPDKPGTIERAQVRGLDPRVDYYFAVRTMDERGNFSPISNLAVRRGRGIGIESVAPLEIFAFAPPRPNPARSVTRIGLRQARRGEALVEAFDLLGRRVRTLMSGMLPAGPTEFMWDLTDDDGHQLQSGMYLLRAQSEGVQKVRRLTIAR